MTNDKDRERGQRNTRADRLAWKVRGRRLGGPQALGGTRDRDRVKRDRQTPT